MMASGGAGDEGPGTTPLYMLQWHEHHTSFFRLMEDLCREQSLTDVSITCGEVSLEAHSLILGASSPILRSILAKGNGKKQNLHFMDMNPFHMQLLMQYMYRGEISVPQPELAPLMASARALQIKGLCSTTSSSPVAPPEAPKQFQTQQQLPQQLQAQPPTQQQLLPPQPTMVQGGGEDRLSEFANYLAAQQPHLAAAAQTTSAASLAQPTVMVASADVQPHHDPMAGVEPPQQPIMAIEAKRRRSSPKAGNNGEGGAAKRKRKSKKPFEELRQENGEIGVGQQPIRVKPDSSVNHNVGEVNDDDDPINLDNSANGNVTENWSDQQTMKAKGHRIPVLPKPLSQMKTTETRSYLSRLIWATNGWKRPQYGNPDTKPVWWPNELLNWAEMKKMGGKKADGLSNVNYNEIQKTILNEGYKYFGFDPETLSHINEESEDTKANDQSSSLAGILTLPYIKIEDENKITVPSQNQSYNIGGAGVAN